MVSIKIPAFKSIGGLKGNFQGNENYRRKFKTTFIVEEEVVLRKKIVSIFEDEVYEDPPYGEPFFSNSNKKSNQHSTWIPRCLSECFPFKKNSSLQSATPTKRKPKLNFRDDEKFYSDSTMMVSSAVIYDQNPINQEDTLEMPSLSSEIQDHMMWRAEMGGYGQESSDGDSDDETSVTSDFKKLGVSNEILLKKTSRPKFKKGTREKELTESSQRTENFIKSETAFQSDSLLQDSKMGQQSMLSNSEDNFIKILQINPIKDRYHYNGPLGEGTFGKVLSCVDTMYKNEMVAIKVNKKAEKYRNFAKHEVQMLTKIRRNDPRGDNSVVILKDWFEIDSHIILVFPQYGDDLYNYLKSIHHRGMKLGDVRNISSQLWKAVDYLHSLKIIHTDIKPENLLFVSNKYKYVNLQDSEKQIKSPVDSKIVLIDLGNAIFGSEEKPRVIVTRYYRPPEVYLETGWDQSVDIWSIGCVMFELYSGHSLFQCREDIEHLWMMEWILRPFPEHLISKSKVREKFFNESGDILAENLNLAKLKKSLRRFEFLMLNKSQFEDPLVDIILRCLKYDPTKRITTKEALKLTFLSPM